MTTSAVESVLVVRHHALGDLLTAVPALRAIRRTYPQHRLVMTCSRNLEPLVRHLRLADALIQEPADTRFDPVEHQEMDDLMVRAVLHGHRTPDVAIAMRVPTRNDLIEGLIAMNPRRLVAFHHPGMSGTAAMPRLTFDEHILSRWDRLLHPAGIVTDPGELHFRPPAPAPAALDGCSIIHVGSATPARRWPTARWAAVAIALEASGHRLILTGSARETALADEIRELAHLPRERDLAGTMDILMLAAAVGTARIVLSTDTGVAHLATALRRPAVTLFGPVPPNWWGPPAGYRLSRSLWKGRMGELYADSTDPGILEISAEEVLDAVAEVEVGSP